jgi:hypothetical protein
MAMYSVVKIFTLDGVFWSCISVVQLSQKSYCIRGLPVLGIWILCSPTVQHSAQGHDKNTPCIALPNLPQTSFLWLITPLITLCLAQIVPHHTKKERCGRLAAWTQNVIQFGLLKTHIYFIEKFSAESLYVFDDVLGTHGQLSVYHHASQTAAHPEFFTGLGWPWGYMQFMFDFKNYCIKIMSSV